ncbi:MAG: metallophosphoesterase family protein [bacterium]
MRIGVVSDSHKNLDNLESAARKLIEEKVQVIIHLGDDYDDAKVLGEFQVELVRIPGVFSSYYQDPRIRNRLVREFCGVKTLITHAPTPHKNDPPGELSPQELIDRERIKVVLHGHTHIPEIKKKAGILWVNPGHLQEEDKRGFPPSFAVVDFEVGKVTGRIIDLRQGRDLAKYQFSPLG